MARHIVRLWFAPRYGMTVREDGVYDMRGGGPGPYRTEYTVTLTSLQPRS
jgi:hypothetical protein